MAIEKIGAGQAIVQSGGTTKAKEKTSAGSGSADRVELSDEAKKLYEAGKTKKFGEIRAKVKSGFYSSPEVTEKVVDGLMKDMKNSK